MIVRIVVVGVLVVAALAAVKNGWMLRRTDLIGSCAAVSAAANGSQWELCHTGRLGGRPDLAGRGCSAQAPTGRLQYWSCPSSAVSGAASV
jgi:hypothetical protein